MNPPRPSLAGQLVPLLRTMRPHQWVKNGLIGLPLITSHRHGDPQSLIRVSLAIAVFCAITSSIYLMNDLRDVAADRQHPKKKHRPLASGALSVPLAIVMAGILLSAAAIVSRLWMPDNFALAALTYVVLATFYTFSFKRRLLIDVIALACLYTLRVIAGGAAIEVEVSAWLLAFCTFFFLSLAMGKRFAELNVLLRQETPNATQRAYRTEDRAVALAAGICSGYMAVLVLSLYVNGESAKQLYSHPDLLWGWCPIMLYWITRIWFLLNREAIDDDPLSFSLRDSRTYLAVLGMAVVLMVAM